MGNKKEPKKQEMNQEQKDTAQEEIKQEETAEASQEQQEDTAEKQIKDLEQKCADYLDKYQRSLAEFDNFRKRTAREKASMYDDGVRDTVEKILPVVDNFERALATQKKEDGEEEDSFCKGIRMILKQLQETLSALGVEEIQALGEKFDPNIHAAVAHIDDEQYGENEIILEMLKGYKYREKVIRHSMVKVAN